jgi:hypothetical protein
LSIYHGDPHETIQTNRHTLIIENIREKYQILEVRPEDDIDGILLNYDRPHISLDGKTPYEVMKSLLE